jgi:hypothetical protein
MSRVGTARLSGGRCNRNISAAGSTHAHLRHSLPSSSISRRNYQSLRFVIFSLHPDAWYWKYPRTTDCNHFTVFTFDWCRRCSSSALISFSFAVMRLPIVSRLTMKRPVLRVEPQMWVKPKKSKVSGFPSPRSFRLLVVKRPNSIRRVFSGCSSRPNFRSRSRNCSRNCSASSRY